MWISLFFVAICVSGLVLVLVWLRRDCRDYGEEEEE